MRCCTRGTHNSAFAELCATQRAAPLNTIAPCVHDSENEGLSVRCSCALSGTGDTFPVGCAFDTAIIHASSFAANPDSHDPRFSSPCGVYEAHCGLANIDMSWGHDEYMAQV